MKPTTSNTHRGNGARRLTGGNHPEYLLTAYLFESISEEGRREVEGHLKGCEACREELEELRGTLGLLRDSVPDASGDLPEYSFDERRLQRVLAAKAQHRAVSWLLQRRRTLMLSAAAVILVGLVTPFLMYVLMLGGLAPAPEMARAPAGAERYGEGFGGVALSPDSKWEIDSSEATFDHVERATVSDWDEGGAAKVAELSEPVSAVTAPEEPAAVKAPAPAIPSLSTAAPSPDDSAPVKLRPQAARGQPGQPGTASTPPMPVGAGTQNKPQFQGGPTPGEGRKSSTASGRRSGLQSEAKGEMPAEEDEAALLEVPRGETATLEYGRAKGLSRERARGNEERSRLAKELQKIPAEDRKQLGDALRGLAGPGPGATEKSAPEALYEDLGAATGVVRELEATEHALGTIRGKKEEVLSIKDAANTDLRTVVSDSPEEAAEAMDRLLTRKPRAALDESEPSESSVERDPAQGDVAGQVMANGFYELVPGQDGVLGGGGSGVAGNLQDWGLQRDGEELPELQMFLKNASGSGAVRESAPGWSLSIAGEGRGAGGYALAKDPSSSAFGDVPVVGKAFRSRFGGVESRFRAYDYYRRLDPELSLESFGARKLSVPSPAVGDEGLGREEFRRRYGVNPFVDTLRDHFSTFGMDVDTASYTFIRNLLRSGKLPDSDAVRTEEWVNYFRGVHQADPDNAFSVFADGGPSPFGKDLELLKITVKAREVRPGERRPLVLTFAVDTSGSMATPVSTEAAQRGVRQGDISAESRLALVRHALRTLSEALEPQDRVALVAYSTHPYLVLPHTPAREISRVLGAIDSLQPTGATNVEAGVDLAYRIADEVFEPKAVNRVVLCSDGVANLGARGPEEILQKVQVFARRGIYLSCVGFGMGRYNDRMLETLADQGNGKYTYVDTAAEAEKLFRDDLSSTLDVLAQDAKIQVDFNSEVVSHYRLLGYENRDIRDQDFRNDKVDAGEVGPGSTVTVLYEIRRRANPRGDLGKIYLRYLDTASRKVEETNYPLSPGVLATELSESSERFRFIAAVAETAELLRDSYWARDGSYGKVLQLLGTLSEEFRSRPEVREFTEVALRAQVLTVQRMAQTVR